MTDPDAKLKLLLEMRKQFRIDNPTLKLSNDAETIERIKQLENEIAEREATKLRLKEIEKIAKERPADMKRLLAQKYNIKTK